MDHFTDQHAVTMMEHCKTILQPYLTDPEASHLPLLPVPVADLQAFVSTADWKAMRIDTILDHWALLHLPVAGSAGSRFWDKTDQISTVPG